MLDLKLLQNDFEKISERLKNKGVAEADLAKLADLFARLKSQRAALEEARAFQNKFSKSRPSEAEQAGLAENKNKISQLAERVRAFEEELASLAQAVPNVPDESVPVGEDESGNVELARLGQPPNFDFTPKDHAQLGAELGWLDVARAVKISGSRFCALRGGGALLSRALGNYFIDFNRSRGFELVSVPLLVSGEAMFSTGQLPKFAGDAYKIEGEDLYAISTSEISLVNLYADELLAEANLPLRLTALTPCFRRESGSAGRDARGLIRLHQFDKAELVAITTPGQSEGVFDEMVKCASELLSSLGLAHRLVELCTGDLGFSAARTVDIEVWLPSQGCYREISSVSNCRAFQARRAKIRYKNAEGKNELAHTLNGSSLALGRAIAAIMENFQTSQGQVVLPGVLDKYL